MARYRTGLDENGPLLVVPLKSGSRANRVVQFDSLMLASSLRKLYEKYFDILDTDGTPTLYTLSEDDESTFRQFSLSFTGCRSAAITEGARHESNPEIVMRFARHRHPNTTMKYYIRETHRQWMKNVTMSIAPSAELLRLSLENKLAQPKEEKAAKSIKASVPGGHCEQAVAGDRSCRRALDCRLCPFFRIHISKRDFFVKEREDALELAQRLHDEQGLMRDAQNLREFAALNHAIISRIDEHRLG